MACDDGERVSGIGMGIGVESVGSRMTACGEHSDFGIEDRRLGGADVIGSDTGNLAVLIEKICSIPLIEDFDTGSKCLLIDRLQQRQTCSVFGIAGTRLALPAERSDGDIAVWFTGKNTSHLLSPSDGFGRFGAHQFYSILICKIIRAFDRVEHMQFYGVLFAKSGVDPSLCSTGVRTERVKLGDDRCLFACHSQLSRRSQTSQTGTNDHGIILIDLNIRWFAHECMSFS